jgi:hypothetical protein
MHFMVNEDKSQIGQLKNQTQIFGPKGAGLIYRYAIGPYQNRSHFLVEGVFNLEHGPISVFPIGMR